LPDYLTVRPQLRKQEAQIPGYHNVVVFDGSTGGRGWECGKLSHLFFYVSWDIFHLNYLTNLHDVKYHIVIYNKNSEMAVR
jgi:hypothetical protein